MPLALGGIETERPQVITWDPTDPQQYQDAADAINRLTAQGFVPREDEGAAGHVTLDPPPRNPNQGVFRILSQNGDDRVVWDRTDPGQVKDAFKKFKELIDKGYTAYALKSDGSKGHKITEFNPGLSEILMVPKTMPS